MTTSLTLAGGGAAANFTSSFQGNVTFEGANSLSLSQSYGGTIDGFGTGDTIDLTSLKYEETQTVASVAAGSGPNDYVVDITEGGASTTLQFEQTPALAQGELTLKADANGGTEVLFAPPTPPLPPVLSGAEGTFYRAGAASASIGAGIDIVDPASATLKGATISISSGFLAGDQLIFTNQNGISGSYNSSTGVLNLTGAASVAVYQAAIDSIAYSSSATDPTNANADATRTLSWSVTDGTTSSSLITNTVDVFSGSDTFVWAGGAGNFSLASSWRPASPGNVPGPPIAGDTADINSAASLFGSGVAYKLYVNAPVTISSPLTTTIGNAAEIGNTAAGSVTVTSMWNEAGYLQVGGAFNGSLTIEAGGVVVVTSSSNPNIGQNSGATGTLTIEDGGQLSTDAQYSTVGDNAGSQGVVSISGIGSSWTMSGAITVGDYGDGQLTVSAGGSLVTNGLTSNDRYDTIGWNTGSTGSVTITGAGSTWKSANQVTVGSYGAVSVTDGGEIQSADGLWLVPGGTLSVDGASVFEAGSNGGAEAGYLTVDPNSYAGGLGTIDAAVIDNGWVSASAGQDNGDNATLPQVLTIDGAVSGSGGMGVGEGLTLALDGAVSNYGGVNFNGWLATLDLGDAAAFNAQINNFLPTDAIDLTNAKFTSASYSISSGDLQFTESGVTYELPVYSPDNLSAAGELTLSKDASGNGTEISFTSAPSGPFQLWSKLGAFYSTSSGPINGQDWASSSATDGGAPIWVETSTQASGYTAGAAETYTISLTSQDWLGTEQPAVTVATDTNFINPFTSNLTGFGNLAGAAITSSEDTTGTGGVIYWQNSTTKGDYAVELQPITTTYVNAPTPTGQNTVLNGAPVTLMAAVADPTSWTSSGELTGLVVAYATPGSTSGTENLYFQGFNASGGAPSPLEEVASGLSDTTADPTQYYIGYGSGAFDYRYTLVDGSETGLYGGSFNVTSGAVGASSELVALPSFTEITGVASRTLSNGSALRLFSGVENGTDVIQAFLGNSTTAQPASATFDLTSASDPFAIANVADPDDSDDDYTAIIYTDNNQVHLELLNASGVRIGSDVVVPGLTSFDRIYTLTSPDSSADTRVEIDYTVADPNGGTEVEGLIYDTAGSPYSYALSGGGEYVGTPFDDTITDAPGNYTVAGGGGSDTFHVNGESSEAQLSQKVAGNVTVTIPGGVTTLEAFSTIRFYDATVTLSDDLLLISGSANVEGSGSAWTTAGGVTVGNSGYGSLTVSNGGALHAADGLNVGTQSSSGNLTIESGGTVATGGEFDTVGANDGDSASATVEGAGSSWTISATLAIDEFGSVSVNDDGLIQAADGIVMSTGSNLYVDDGKSVIEAGSLGGGTAGYLTIDKGFLAARRRLGQRRRRRQRRDHGKRRNAADQQRLPDGRRRPRHRRIVGIGSEQ